jgi:hypothetical protein
MLRISRNSVPKWAQNMYPVLTATNPCHDGKNFDELGVFSRERETAAKWVAQRQY